MLPIVVYTVDRVSTSRALATGRPDRVVAMTGAIMSPQLCLTGPRLTQSMMRASRA